MQLFTLYVFGLPSDDHHVIGIERKRCIANIMVIESIEITVVLAYDTAAFDNATFYWCCACYPGDARELN